MQSGVVAHGSQKTPTRLSTNFWTCSCLSSRFSWKTNSEQPRTRPAFTKHNRIRRIEPWDHSCDCPRLILRHSGAHFTKQGDKPLWKTHSSHSWVSAKPWPWTRIAPGAGSCTVYRPWKPCSLMIISGIMTCNQP